MLGGVSHSQTKLSFPFLPFRCSLSLLAPPLSLRVYSLFIILKKLCVNRSRLTASPPFFYSASILYRHSSPRLNASRANRHAFNLVSMGSFILCLLHTDM
eukprot:TRINITY_DN5478_c0_g1_i1.p1 TRINITY_DN5478_c0_g1~~TRINITY_DN5478_c0_g1_i1.p1  ORF type:complete len:100 (+),score=11.00 TRINITY_DN5478_c0_g1_i1:306-605(+)